MLGIRVITVTASDDCICTGCQAPREVLNVLSFPEPADDAGMGGGGTRRPRPGEARLLMYTAKDWSQGVSPKQNLPLKQGSQYDVGVRLRRLIDVARGHITAVPGAAQARMMPAPTFRTPA